MKLADRGAAKTRAGESGLKAFKAPIQVRVLHVSTAFLLPSSMSPPRRLTGSYKDAGRMPFGLSLFKISI